MNASGKRPSRAIAVALKSGWKPYLGTAAFLLFAFFSLHYLGNQLPRERSYEVVREAFEKDNLVVANYLPFNNSIQSLIGHDQFAECQVLNSMITPPSNRVEDAIVPKGLFTLDFEKQGDAYCPALYRIVVQNREHQTFPLKHRYWHGFKALVALALRWDEMDLFQVNVGIKTLTYFAYLLLAVVALVHSFRLLAVLSPFIFFGFFFSGIPYFGGFAYSLAYLFSIVALAAQVLLMKLKVSARALGLFFFASGMISSYLFFLDGHLIALLPMSMVVLYFGRGHVENIRRWSFETISFLLSFLAGFTLSVGVNQAAKGYYAGFDRVFSTFGKELMVRANLIHHETTIVDNVTAILFSKYLIGYYWHNGFMGNKTLFVCALLTSCLALTVAIAMSVYRAYSEKNVATVFGVIVILAAMAMVLIRIIGFSQHTMIHPSFISRYMFVLVALSWATLIAALYETRRNRPRKEKARGAREAERETREITPQRQEHSRLTSAIKPEVHS